MLMIRETVLDVIHEIVFFTTHDDLELENVTVFLWLNWVIIPPRCLSTVAQNMLASEIYIEVEG
jgi:hypothetical protein